MLHRRHAWALVAALASVVLIAHPARADDYPTRPVTIIVPQPPGGGTDIIARLIGDQLSRRLGQPFVIENRTGAGTVAGTVTAARASADGYTLLAGLTSNMAVNPSLYANLGYDPIRDFAPVAMLADYPFVLLVSNNLPVHSVKELITLAKEKPGKINYASAGIGTGQHLSMELFKMLAGINLTHVPYRGAAPAYTDVIPGTVPVFFDNLSSGMGQIQAGTVRALAVSGKERAPLFPDVPTIAEAGVPDYVNYVWFGLWAPKKTPQPILEKLHATVQQALADPAVAARITATAGVPSKMPLADIEPFVKSEIAKWAEVVKRAGIEMQ